MTDFFSDTLTDWQRQAAERADREAHRAQQQRQAVVKLLGARGHRAAAAIVLMSAWRTEDVEERWESDLCRGVLSVPPEGFDAVDQTMRDVIAEAAVAVVSEGFTELAVQVRLEEAEPAWDGQLVARLREQDARDTASAATPVVFELAPGSWDAG